MVCSGDKALRELPSPGKSGSVFFISHDERFFIKTMRKGGVPVATLSPVVASAKQEVDDLMLPRVLS